MGPDAMMLVFWMSSFKPTFPLSFYTFIRRLFRSSLLSAIRVLSSEYPRLLIFLRAILIPACASSSPAFLMMYFSYKLNKHGDNIQPWRTPFPIWNQPNQLLHVPFCCFLTYIQVSQEAGQVVWYSHLFKNFPWFVVIQQTMSKALVQLLSMLCVCGAYCVHVACILCACAGYVLCMFCECCMYVVLI